LKKLQFCWIKFTIIRRFQWNHGIFISLELLHFKKSLFASMWGISYIWELHGAAEIQIIVKPGRLRTLCFFFYFVSSPDSRQEVTSGADAKFWAQKSYLFKFYQSILWSKWFRFSSELPIKFVNRRLGLLTSGYCRCPEVEWHICGLPTWTVQKRSNNKLDTGYMFIQWWL